MTKFKLLAVATVLSAMIATPGIAQQAVQEPGLQAFYQLGCWIPRRAGGRGGMGSPGFVRERASKAHSSEASRPRSQPVTEPQMDRSSPKPEGRPYGSPFPLG